MFASSALGRTRTTVSPCRADRQLKVVSTSEDRCSSSPDRTGKTRVLVARIAHLVGETWVRPEWVLALAFSHRATDEMRARVPARLPEAEKVEARTFHSFALSMLRRLAGPLGLRSASEVVPTNEKWALVSDILGSEDTEA